MTLMLFDTRTTRRLKNDSFVMLYLVAAVILISIAVKGYDMFLLCDNVHIVNSKLWFSKAGYTNNDFAWFVIANFFLPTGFVCGLIFLVQFAKGKLNIWAKHLILYTLLGVTLWGISKSHDLVSETLSCGVFCFGKVSQATATMTAAEGFIGMTYLGFCLFYMLALVYVLMSLHWKQMMDYCSSNNNKSTVTNDILQHESTIELNKFETIDIQELIPTSESTRIISSTQESNSVTKNKSSKTILVLKQIIAFILTFIVLFPFLFFCTMALPTSWKSMSLLKIRTFQASVPDSKVEFYWKSTINTDLIFKLYPDVLFYYGFIYIVLALTCLSNYIQSIKRILRSRMKLFPSYTLGEILMMTMLTGLIIGEFCYYYCYVPVIAKSTKTPAEQSAVAVGQTASIVMGLLLLPITRNSIWSVLFGISPNSLILFHEVLGFLFLALVAIHGLLWWKVFDETDAFPADVMGIPTVTHANNPTIPLLEIGAIFTFICIAFPSILPSFRRAYFEAFYYLHHFFVILFLMVLWHATRSWYFVTASLILWVADHALRLMKCIGTEVEVVSLNVFSNGSVIQLTYQDVLKWNSFNIQPGQYMYINIPSISTLQWHPFTISGVDVDVSPSSTTLSSSSSTATTTMITHTIKNRGELQWTGKLAQIAMNAHNNSKIVATNESTSSSSSSSLELLSLKDIVVIVDGPYGPPLSLSEYSHVLLVAGGIGITPYASLLNTICDEREQVNHNGLKMSSGGGDGSSSCCSCSTYHLIWIVKHLSDIDSFTDLIYRCNTVEIDVSIHVTQDDIANEEKRFTIHRGRPNMQTEIQKLEMYGQQAMVAVCGPLSLVDECCRLSTAISFRSDLFEY